MRECIIFIVLIE